MGQRITFREWLYNSLATNPNLLDEAIVDVDRGAELLREDWDRTGNTRVAIVRLELPPINPCWSGTALLRRVAMERMSKQEFCEQHLQQPPQPQLPGIKCPRCHQADSLVPPDDQNKSQMFRCQSCKCQIPPDEAMALIRAWARGEKR